MKPGRAGSDRQSIGTESDSGALTLAKPCGCLGRASESLPLDIATKASLTVTPHRLTKWSLATVTIPARHGGTSPWQCRPADDCHAREVVPSAGAPLRATGGAPSAAGRDYLTISEHFASMLGQRE